MQTKCVQKSSKPAKNGRFCRPAISSSKWGASLLKVTYGFLWLWSSYFSLTAAQYNTHELFNSCLTNQMGIFSTRWIFWLSLYRTIQVIPASKPYPIHGSNFRVWKWSEPSENLPWKQLTIDPSCLDRTSWWPEKGQNIDRCVVINNAVFKIRAEQYQIN